MTEISISNARAELDDLVRRAAHGRQTVALTDQGQVAPLLVSPQVIEDLEDSVAIAERERHEAQGTLGEGISHEEVGRLLGLRA